MLHPIKNGLRYIVVGTGRCGSVYFANILNAIGIPCSHERIFIAKGKDYAKKVLSGEAGKNSEVAGWAGLKEIDHPQAEASYLSMPFLDEPFLKAATIIHIVRDPLKVIKSFSNKLEYWRDSNLNQYENFIQRNLPGIEQYSGSLLRCCYFVINWNKRIESYSHRKYLRIRLEADTDMLLDYLKTPDTLRQNISRGVINAYESWPPVKEALDPKYYITDKHILESSLGDEVREMSRRYGYEV